MIKNYLHWLPQIDTSVFVASSADIIGRVSIGADSSIWYQSVLRGDVHDIIIGERSNIQDHSVLHTSQAVSPCVVGNDVTIGHRVTLHGCEVQDGCLVGMGSIIMDQAVLESGCFLAAGSLVTERKILRGGFLYAGVPAREKRPLRDEEIKFLTKSARHYVQVAHHHKQD
ncbi:MAG: gamma carbonic anhydrase family protein [Zetaproteobacteria bacterium CG_4_9_14_3_um_filter_49_83]|nr:MAG: gamma carbonic anhydrase family protein [Zetaproteobacteria bacterium CG1_02_49_23]PIQ33468.1 MAG: gamma carbonic anhydrase family protein [Zetaproteobacteria bacterium CG17_big_fil_post_rev_8_21_14_2_50_50_13]PIV30328.1 MAG: gamma carbonic anhydrase family protein [Zetaproteobacteria bacterium CG02_land_8_20_14_3_00_50_9]PIY55675.1 MAG: gamma carbonic anhydrase family protein [Zetaproteobacteria bacterium CG_4_10_14_0_8_um_filter_49_80]PJA36026.1 MAG: gamma carbonic anhydrase family pr